MYTDWVAIGLAKIPDADITLLKFYIVSNDLAENLALTEYERRAMTLLALNVDPAIGTKINYIKKITDTFDGAQFGDKNLYNDDIFAIIPLLHAGYTWTDLEIQKAVTFIISKQHADGSWDGIDITAATIQALSPVRNLPEVSDALSKARMYLINAQMPDGGFGSSFGTSWAIGAIKVLNESPDIWQKNNLNPNDALVVLQASDGGVEPLTTETNTRLWATAYAIPSALSLSWDSILGYFEKVKPVPLSELQPQPMPKIVSIKKITSLKTITKPPVEKNIAFKPKVSENILIANVISTTNERAFPVKRAIVIVLLSLSIIPLSLWFFRKP